MKQQTMFTNGEDLPLFSGTPQSVTVRTEPTPGANSDQTSFAECRICFGTGRIHHRYCWCEAGIALRLQHRQEGNAL